MASLAVHLIGARKRWRGSFRRAGESGLSIEATCGDPFDLEGPLGRAADPLVPTLPLDGTGDPYQAFCFFS
jgi:hypothetical protein